MIIVNVKTAIKSEELGKTSPEGLGSPGEPDRAQQFQPRYAMEECGCGCDSCMGGNAEYEYDADDSGIKYFELVMHNPETLEVDDSVLYEKKDRCYRLAKQKYRVFPSAYASGFIVRCRKGKVAKKKNEATELEEGTFDKEKKQGLHGWFARKGGKGKSQGWVDCNTCRTDPKTGRKKCKSCGRQEGEKRSKYPACRPTPSACNKAGTSKKKSSKRVSWKKKGDE